MGYLLARGCKEVDMKDLFDEWFNKQGEAYGGALPAFELIEVWSEAAFKAGMLAAAEIANEEAEIQTPLNSAWAYGSRLAAAYVRKAAEK